MSQRRFMAASPGKARHWRLAVIFVAMTAMLGSAQAQQRWALLIGVSRYDNLEESLQLHGPGNDVALAAAVLRQNGFAPERMRVLAEAPIGDARPTRAAIMAALADLAARSRSGDFVYVHFAGHGAQQPARRTSDEPDARDEIFLPADVGRWAGKDGPVDNAIVDDEIGVALGAIRANGAFVWAVFDACHSGTMTRGVPVEDVRVRQVAPSALGIPTTVDRDDAARGSRAAPSRRDRLAGASVAFYAAHSNELAFEKRLPATSKQRKTHGLLTFTMLSVIAANPGITYRQAAQRILQSYGADYPGGLGPLFEGSGLDAPVFGTTAAPTIRQWPVRRDGATIRIAGGAMHRIGEGAEFVLLPHPAARIDQALGHARAIDVAALETVLQITDMAGGALPAAALPSDAYARLTGASFRTELRIAPPPLETLPPALAAAVRDILDPEALRAAVGEEGISLTWTEPDGAADIRLLAEQARGMQPPQLWFLSSTGELVRDGPGRNYSVPLLAERDAARQAVATGIARIGNAMNLLRLASMLERPASPARASLGVAVRRVGTDVSIDIAPQETPTLFEGDRLSLRLVNADDRPMDMTLLAIDREHGITPVFPFTTDENNRVEGHGEQVIEVMVKDATPGTERLILIAVPAEVGTERVDFSFLAQPRLIRLRGGGAAEPGRRDLRSLLAAAGLRPASTRGASAGGHAAPESVEIQVFTWSTQPRR